MELSGAFLNEDCVKKVFTALFRGGTSVKLLNDLPIDPWASGLPVVWTPKAHDAVSCAHHAFVQLPEMVRRGHRGAIMRNENIKALVAASAVSKAWASCVEQWFATERKQLIDSPVFSAHYSALPPLYPNAHEIYAASFAHLGEPSKEDKLVFARTK